MVQDFVHPQYGGGFFKTGFGWIPFLGGIGEVSPPILADFSGWIGGCSGF